MTSTFYRDQFLRLNPNPAAALLVPVASVLILFLLMEPDPARAHGVVTQYVKRTGVEIQARYDTGQPLAGGQVTVYAPPDSGHPPSTPWLTGVCDDQGRFAFVPDAGMPGIWSVRVRQAGHGDMLHIAVEAPNDTGVVAAGSSGRLTRLQIAVMVLCVVWGSIGSALYFSRRRSA